MVRDDGHLLLMRGVTTPGLKKMLDFGPFMF